MKRLLICIFAVIFLSGCATMPTIYSIKNSDFFNADYDEIWTATMQVLAELNYPLRTTDKSSGVITTDYVSISSNEIRTYAQFYRPLLDMSGRYNLNIIISKSGETNTIKINSNLEAWEQVGYGSGYWEGRPSNGFIESRIFNKIREKIGSELQSSRETDEQDEQYKEMKLKAPPLKCGIGQ